MLVKTEGIVLRQIPFSETSLIVKIFTRDFGLVSFILKGVKGKKSQRGHLFKPINILEFSFFQRENKSLKQMKEVQLLFAPDAREFGIYKSSVAMMMIEILNQTIPEESMVDREKYDFIRHSYDYLINQPLHSVFYLSFLFQYSIFLGLEFQATTIYSVDFLHQLSSYSLMESMKLNRMDRKLFFKEIEQHYLENLTNYKSLKSIGIIEEILDESSLH